MDPVEPNIHSFIVKVWQEVVVGDAADQGWRGYVTHVPSGSRRYFEDLAEILALVKPTLAVEAFALTRLPDQQPSEPEPVDDVADGAPQANEARSGPEEVEMDSSPSGLDVLLKQLEKGNKAVDGYTTQAADAQAKLKTARETQAALQHAIDQVKSSTTAIDKAVAAAIGPKANAEKTRADIASALKTQLTDDQRAAVTKIVKEADERHKGLVEDRSDSAEAVATAQHEADAAAAENSAATAKLASAHAALKAHGASIQELAVRVTALSGSAKAALDAGRLGAAFRFNQQLESALGRLGELTNPDHAANLQEQIADAWTEVGETTGAVATTADELAMAKNALQEADAKVKADDALRESAIDQQIMTLEQQWAAKRSTPKTPAPSDSTAETPDQTSDYGEATA